MRSIKNKLLDNKGVTLLELMVAVSLFAMTVILASTIFESVIRSQREAIVSQEMQENMRYSFEKLGKEIRTAQRDKTNSCIPSGSRIYWTNGTQLEFLNYHQKCVCYRLHNNRLEVSSDGGCDGTFMPLTPQKLIISNLRFIVSDGVLNEKQAFVTMKMHINVFVQGTINEHLDVQTSLSSRFYE